MIFLSLFATRGAIAQRYPCRLASGYIEQARSRYTCTRSVPTYNNIHTPLYRLCAQTKNNNNKRCRVPDILGGALNGKLRRPYSTMNIILSLFLCSRILYIICIDIFAIGYLSDYIIPNAATDIYTYTYIRVYR